MAEKKRKRQTDAAEALPSKRVALNGDDVTGKIKVSHVDVPGLAPIVVSSSAITTPKVPFKAYTKAVSNKPSSDTSTQPANHHVLLHSSEHPRLDYTALQSTTDKNLAHYIAVFDPATNDLKLAPAYHLTLKSTLRSDPQDTEEAIRTYYQQREELGREFGTKKAKKAIESRTVNAITEGSEGKDKQTAIQSAILEDVADTTAGDASQSVADTQEASLATKPIPKPNLAAEFVADVYPLSTLIPATDMRLVPIKDWQDKTRANEDIKFSHRFVAYRLKNVVNLDDPNKLKALAYLCLLLEFHDSLSNAGRGGGKKIPKKDILAKRLEAWPQQLVENVRRRFADSSGTALPKWYMDNLYTHMCALSLYVDEWAMEISNLRDDLKMETKQLSQYYHEIGCKVGALTEAERNARGIGKAVAVTTRMARLKLPLDFPKANRGRRR